MTDATTQQPLIELKHVDKHFGSLHVLRDINLSIVPGEVRRGYRPIRVGQIDPLPCHQWSGDHRLG